LVDSQKESVEVREIPEGAREIQWKQWNASDRQWKSSGNSGTPVELTEIL
jgi:hypothetical protein